jgi:hypothetical protein
VDSARTARWERCVGVLRVLLLLWIITIGPGGLWDYCFALPLSSPFALFDVAGCVPTSTSAHPTVPVFRAASSPHQLPSDASPCPVVITSTTIQRKRIYTIIKALETASFPPSFSVYTHNTASKEAHASSQSFLPWCEDASGLCCPSTNAKTNACCRDLRFRLMIRWPLNHLQIGCPNAS